MDHLINLMKVMPFLEKFILKTAYQLLNLSVAFCNCLYCISLF